MIAVPHPLAPGARLVSARDLAWLIGSLVLVAAPHALRAPWWLTVLTLCLFAWRFWYALNGAPLPSRWLVIGVAAVAMLGVWMEYRTLFGRQPGIILLVLFAGLKLLETRTHRDAALAAFLGYFLIITNFLYTQSIPTAALMCAALFALTATLVGFSAPRRSLKANLRSAWLLLAHAAPAALVLFLLFPRVQGPLWGLPQDAYSGMTGLSESMSPGNLASLAQSDAIAFRAEFRGQTPPHAQRYWRGPVLWDFDGRTWSMIPVLLRDFTPPRGGRPYPYDVVLEPHNRPWLFALESAASLPQGSRMTRDGQVLAAGPVRSRVRYEITSVVTPDADAQEDARLLSRALRLPPDSNPRAAALAAEWRAASSGDAEILARAIAFLRAGRYSYTLEPATLGVQPVDDFLFNTKEGFCEHFASAFVFLLRAAGVPARVVTGYQGADLLPTDDYTIVRQSAAHAWAKYWQAGVGWVRADPTAAVAPNRILRSRRLAPPPGLMAGALGTMSPELLAQLRGAWETLNNRWNQWVMNYSRGQQFDLLKNLGFDSPSWEDLSLLLIGALSSLALAGAAWAWWDRHRVDPWVRQMERLRRALQTLGVAASAHDAPRTLARRVRDRLGPAADALVDVLDTIDRQRYGRVPVSRPDGALTRRFIAAARRLVRIR